MQDIYYQKKIYVIPDNWNELNAKQLIAIADILHNSKAKPEVKELQILKALMNVSWFKFLCLSSDLKLRLLDYIQWVGDDKLKLTESIITSYRKNIFSKKLYAPQNEFNNLKMVEFHYAEVAYRMLIDTREDQYLDELVAVLFRIGKKDYDFKRNREGDIRIAFNDADITYHKKIVTKWPKAIKQAILLYYDGCRQMLVEEYPDVYNGKKSTENYYAGLYTMIRSLAGEKYGTIENVEQLNVHTAHLEMTCNIEDARALEEAYKQQQS